MLTVNSDMPFFLINNGVGQVNITPLPIYYISHQGPLPILSHGVVGPQTQSLLC